MTINLGAEPVDTHEWMYCIKLESTFLKNTFDVERMRQKKCKLSHTLHSQG